jgi:cytochrome b561
MAYSRHARPDQQNVFGTFALDHCRGFDPAHDAPGGLPAPRSVCAPTISFFGETMTTTTLDSASNRPSSYGALAVAIHWLIFFAVIALFVLVNYAGSLEKTDPMRATVMDWHKAIGVIVLGVAALRILWIKIHGAPDLVPSPRITEVIARISHGLLYLLLLAVPATGLGMVLAAGRGVTLLGIPPLFEANKQLAGILHSAHGVIFMTCAVVILIHVIGALWHQYGRRDETLGRMVPWLRKG